MTMRRRRGAAAAALADAVFLAGCGAETVSFDNPAKKGWERQKTGKQTTITAKKGDCTALADGTFSRHRSETKPGDADVVIAVRCELH
ncbi:hypothetical protein ACFXPW_30000 [Streptomyces goshikiensis]|uniref:hypothetical protein n=1 Tax=Streptomyces goshikiensis TaxID=1942 RepID=UPI0036B220EF